MKSQIGLGVLAIPSVFHSLGMIPGIICLIVIGALTTWTDYWIGMFKLNHPTVCASSSHVGRGPSDELPADSFTSLSQTRSPTAA